MVKVYGPLMGLDASGSLANAITFSKWKGRNYVRHRVVPANPQSGLQTGVRAMMSALAKCWTTMTATQQGYWDDLAAATSISPFNAFVQFNLERFAQFKSPVIDNDDTDNSDTPPQATTPTIVAGVKSVTITWAYVHQYGCFGSWAFRSTATPVTPSRANLVFGYLNRTDSATIWIDTPLDPGTYYYDAGYSVGDGYIFEQVANNVEVTVE